MLHQIGAIAVTKHHLGKGGANTSKTGYRDDECGVLKAEMQVEAIQAIAEQVRDIWTEAVDYVLISGVGGNAEGRGARIQW